MSKTVATPDAKYAEYSAMWTKCRDAIKGHDKVQNEGETYLPKLSGQDKDDYQKYLKQAMFYNASGRTFDGYKGLVFRKDPDINADQIEEFVADCTLSGKSLKEFSELAVEEELKVSRFGILVDHPKLDKDSDLSQAEAEQLGIRPYLIAYKAEDILEVKTARIGPVTRLVQVRLKETVNEPTDDEFEDEQITQIRVLDLEDSARYRQRVFRKVSKDSDKWEEVEDMRRYPEIGGKVIDEIPFYMPGGYEFREPHMIDLVNTNLNHYIKDADHSRGVSFTTRPQHLLFGVKDDDMPKPFVLGGGHVYNFPDPEASADLLEYSGEGLKASENQLQKREEQMANLGARMLMPENQADETATEFVIKKQGENSALGGVSQLVSKALTNASQFAARWMDARDPEQINIQLNTDFIPFRATPEDLVKMIGAVQSGTYTLDDYLWWLAEVEMVDPSIDHDERRAQIETTPPVGMGNNPPINNGA